MRHHGGEARLHVLRRARQERRVENTRQDRVAADLRIREIARHHQRDADDAGLGRGIGDLADLAVFRRNRRGVDDRATVAAGQDRQIEHAGGRFGDAAERADQIDVDDALEIVERIFLGLLGLAVDRGRLRRAAADACAVNENALLTIGRARLGEAGVDVLGRGDVDLAEHAADLFRQLLAELFVEVENRAFHAVGGEHANRRRAEARGAARDNGRNLIVEFHPCTPPHADRDLIARLNPEAQYAKIRNAKDPSRMAVMRAAGFAPRKL